MAQHPNRGEVILHQSSLKRDDVFPTIVQETWDQIPDVRVELDFDFTFW
jgi:hypothetical protein